MIPLQKPTIKGKILISSTVLEEKSWEDSEVKERGKGKRDEHVGLQRIPKNAVSLTSTEDGSEV